MAVAKARLLWPLDYITVGVERTALVLGGGVAGMTSALTLADQGYQVHLVERKDHLGGNALKLHTTWRGGLVKPRVEALAKQVLSNDKITVHFNSIITGVKGAVGNFTSTLSGGEEIRHGIVILAIGGAVAARRGKFLQENLNVILWTWMGDPGESWRLITQAVASSSVWPRPRSGPTVTRSAVLTRWKTPSSSR
jgi:heterodisulfide reductase subunit A